jgi:hypothetical protein
MAGNDGLEVKPAIYAHRRALILSGMVRVLLLEDS